MRAGGTYVAPKSSRIRKQDATVELDWDNLGMNKA